MTSTAEKCGLCETRDMEEVSRDPSKGVFLMCPNCDDPKGIMPERKAETP